MPTRVLYGHSEDGPFAIMYDSVTNWTFDPMFKSEECAWQFIDWLADAGKHSGYSYDPREFDHGADLERLYVKWINR